MVILGLSCQSRKIELKNIIKIIYGIIIGVIFHFLSDIVKTFGQTGTLNIFYQSGQFRSF